MHGSIRLASLERFIPAAITIRFFFSINFSVLLLSFLYFTPTVFLAR